MYEKKHASGSLNRLDLKPIGHQANAYTTALRPLSISQLTVRVHN